MVEVEASKGVLRAVLDAYPDQGVIVGVNLRPGWDDVVVVDVFTGRDQQSGLSVDPKSQDRLRWAIKTALQSHRSDVLVVEVEV